MGIYGGYTFDVFRIAFVFSMPTLIFLFRGIKAYKVFRTQRAEYKRVNREYQQLFSSGFLKEFQKKEYAKLVERYKEVVENEWVEPIEIVKKGRKRR